jgi:hypothetical protein
MPTFSRFYGILIRMYFDDHNPPHFHVICGAANGVLAGDLPDRALGLVREWAGQHRDELMQDWRRARDRRELSPIAPLE